MTALLSLSAQRPLQNMLRQLLLTLRSGVFYLGYVLITVVISTSFILLFPLLKSSGRHRVAAAWCRSTLRWLKLSCGISYTVEGAENLNRCPTVYLANHQSSFEAILFYQLIYPVSPILKRELLQIPFWGWALRLVKPVAIDRSKPREAARSLMAQGEAMLKEGNSIIIFPEGSRSEPGVVGRFSRGGTALAAAAEVPIVPIVHNSGYAWPSHRFIKLPGVVSIKVGDPIHVTDRSVKNLTHDVEQWARANFQARDSR